MNNVLPTERVQLSAEGRFLVMLAQDRYTASDWQYLADLARQVVNWEFVVERSAEHFILPLAYRALRGLPAGIVPAEILAEIKRRALPMLMRALAFVAEQRHFSEAILKPSGIPHVFIKGQALAGSYYHEPGERNCRDVDLLVHKESLVQVAELAQRQGYKVFPNRGVLSRRDLVAAARFYPVISLLGPKNILMEVHSELDKTNLLFDTSHLLDRSTERSVHGLPLSVLPLAEHFVFVCLHSTRHLWSHLSWLVDIDVMARHRDFKEPEVLEFAQQCGIRSTVEACLELYRVTRRPDFGRDDFSNQARDLFDALVVHVEEGPKIEFKLRQNRPSPDFSFDWQATPEYRRKTRLKTRFSFMKPNFEDYKAFPLPSYLHWLYYVTRPFSAIFRRSAHLASDRMKS